MNKKLSSFNKKPKKSMIDNKLLIRILLYFSKKIF